jgi:hypothetical protein
MGDRTLPTTAAVLRRGKFKLRHDLQPILVAADACPGEGRGRTRPVRPAGCEIFRMRTHNVLPPREQAPHRIERPPASTGPHRPDGRMLAARCQSSHLSRLTGATANVPTQPWSNTLRKMHGPTALLLSRHSDNPPGPPPPPCGAIRHAVPRERGYRQRNVPPSPSRSANQHPMQPPPARHPNPTATTTAS